MCSDPGQDLIKEDIQKLGVEPRRRGGLLADHARADVPQGRGRRRAQPVPAPDGQHPRALLLGHRGQGRGHREGQAHPERADPPPAVQRAARAHRGAGQPGRAWWSAAASPASRPRSSSRATGKKVYLVEKKPSIGGHMAMFDKTFPTLDCAACILTPKMSAAGKDPNIDDARLQRGRGGRRLRRQLQGQGPQEGPLRRHRQVHRLRAPARRPASCARCRTSSTRGSASARAIYIPFPQAVPLRATIDAEKCLTLKGKKCKQPCITACGPQAIDFEQQDEVLDLEVGAIIMATGFELWEPRRRSTRYGYGRLDNVITSLEFERISNASGPTGGHIVCKNGEAPKSVAILHCVGSRDENYQEYCSRVCCMYSLKFSHLIKEHLPETEVYELLHRHALLRQGLRGVLQAPHGRGRALRARPRRRGDQRGALAGRGGAPRSSRSRTRCSASCGASRSTW